MSRDRTTKATRLLTTSPPAVEPVSVAELKASARINFIDDDAVLAGVLLQARQWVERVASIRLITQAVVVYRDDWRRTMYLPLGPIQSVTAIEYLATNGTSQTLAASGYAVDVTSTPPCIIIPASTALPALQADRPNRVMVEAIAGYGDAGSDVPQPILEAIKLYAQAQYDLTVAAVQQNARGIEAMMTAAHNLLAPYWMDGYQ